jgi:uncharacterized membrane protein
MQKVAVWFSWFVIFLYFVLGVYILTSSRFNYLAKEFKVIFAIFLFLYGAFRMARLWTKSREKNDD